MTTKQKGDIAEYRVITELLRKGYAVLLPCGDRLPYDLAVDLGEGRICRIQVKSAWRIQDNNNETSKKYGVDVRQSQTNRKLYKTTKHPPNTYDIFIAWIQEMDVFYIFPSHVAYMYGSTISMVEGDAMNKTRARSFSYRERWDMIGKTGGQSPDRTADLSDVSRALSQLS